jgi:putative PIN family toxin of toxin-antitoxin system
MSSAPIVVLDTNIALDWLVFEDGGMPELMAAIEARQIVIATNDACIDELKRVLAYPIFALDQATQDGCLTKYTAVAKPFAPRASLLGRVPRCRDRDDQKFLELAAHAGAEALISKDNAVLGLRRSMKERFACDLLAPKNTAPWLASRVGAASKTEA